MRPRTNEQRGEYRKLLEQLGGKPHVQIWGTPVCRYLMYDNVYVKFPFGLRNKTRTKIPYMKMLIALRELAR